MKAPNKVLISPVTKRQVFRVLDTGLLSYRYSANDLIIALKYRFFVLNYQSGQISFVVHVVVLFTFKT